MCYISTATVVMARKSRPEKSQPGDESPDKENSGEGGQRGESMDIDLSGLGSDEENVWSSASSAGSPAKPSPNKPDAGTADNTALEDKSNASGASPGKPLQRASSDSTSTSEDTKQLRREQAQAKIDKEEADRTMKAKSEELDRRAQEKKDKKEADRIAKEAKKQAELEAKKNKPATSADGGGEAETTAPIAPVAQQWTAEVSLLIVPC